MVFVLAYRSKANGNNAISASPTKPYTCGAVGAISFVHVSRPTRANDPLVIYNINVTGVNVSGIVPLQIW